MTGQWPHGIDHINLNPSDNRWCNLREANQHQNLGNTRDRKNNTSGFKGVHWAKDKKLWVASIMVYYKPKFLGYFKNKEQAAEAYRNAAEKYFGEYSNVT